MLDVIERVLSLPLPTRSERFALKIAELSPRLARCLLSSAPSNSSDYLYAFFVLLMVFKVLFLHLTSPIESLDFPHDHEQQFVVTRSDSE